MILAVRKSNVKRVDFESCRAGPAPFDGGRCRGSGQTCGRAPFLWGLSPAVQNLWTKQLFLNHVLMQSGLFFHVPLGVSATGTTTNMAPPGGGAAELERGGPQAAAAMLQGDAALWA